MRGWERDPEAPESRFFVLGGSNATTLGTFAQYVVVERDQVIPTPDHLDDVHAAAWPLGAVTAWRATMVNGAVKQGDNVLITGIGGGVALTALQLCVARGANVYVTSGGEDKIRKAVALGAKGGVSYKAEDWPKQLAGLLKKNGASALSVVIDAGGGDIMGKTSGILKPGGRVVARESKSDHDDAGSDEEPETYRFVTPRQLFATARSLTDVPAHFHCIGSTMGSKQDLIDATNFLAQHRIVPIVSEVLDGLEAAERGFQILERGDQFGKIVIRVADSSPKPVSAKL
ncbi:hypothetical protein TRAPUB_245 [Trametes pubescens]|uniref:Enoyl reductase (ER) domain-containing protein n=1 Tax=Trametes pubescens TaxID=154538 RepID=A0A1M2VMR4_TRAPU|nr:hypothetical protein TRAPUB_245 [Trametes pubescens]